MKEIKIDAVRWIKELYPRLKPSDEVIERYRSALERLPPIAIARDGVLVDGYHRWQAHVRETAKMIRVEDLGNLTDAEIRRESIIRNASHGEQLSAQDKRRLAAVLWTDLKAADMKASERVADIAELLSVSTRAVEAWTKDARQNEKAEQQAKTWDLWLDCLSEREIAEQIGITHPTVGEWLVDLRKSAEFFQPPPSRQHFDIWSFAQADKNGGQQSYFGALPPQVIENILWFWTDPGEIVVDLFAGSGTVIDVAKTMGRRVWASDIRGNDYSPHLPIHKHDATDGWPKEAPSKATLVILDPPYWRQAKGHYSNDRNEMAEMGLDRFYDSWGAVVKDAVKHASRIAYIVSPAEVKEDGQVVDLATAMLEPFQRAKWSVERRVIVPYQTQQATGQQVEWARKNRVMLKLYRDLIILSE